MAGAIDVMNYAPFVAPGLAGPEYQSEEIQTMIRTTYRSQVQGGEISTPWGRRIPIDEPVAEDRTLDIAGAVAKMQATDLDLVVLACLKMWSYHWSHELIIDHPEEVVAQAVAQAGDRFIGGVGYNPFAIEESLRRVDFFVRERQFKYVYFHPLTFGLAPNDRRCYPLYAKCVELGIPVGFQVGHSAETFPSYHGRPMNVDDVAIEFPSLKINLSHTGWPWTGELISMAWRHPNVYADISSYFPNSLDEELVRAMDGRIRHKVMFGTNGLDANRWQQEFEQLPLRDKSRARILRENALEFFDL